MNKKVFLNILENILPPTLNQALNTWFLKGRQSLAEVTLTSQTTYVVPFNSDNTFVKLVLGAQNLTALTATIGDLSEGEEVILRVTQDGSAARTVVFGTGFTNPFGLIVTPLIDVVDYYLGVVDGGSITLLNLTPNTDVGILAALGSDQAGAALMVTCEVLVTGVDDAKGVRLPPVTPDRIITIHITDSDKDLKIYPATGEKINGGSVNASVLLVNPVSDTSTARCFKKADGDWYCLVIRGTLT